MMKDEYFFVYGEKEISFLKAKDKRLGEVIEKVGLIERKVIPDLFSALFTLLSVSRFLLKLIPQFGTE